MTSTLPATSNGLSGGNVQATDGVVQTVSAQISARLKAAGVSFLANDNIADFILPGEMQALEAEVGDRVRDLLRSLVIDIENDHNTEETAERVARMYLHEVFKGRYHQQPKGQLPQRERARRDLHRWSDHRSFSLFASPGADHGQLLDWHQAW